MASPWTETKSCVVAWYIGVAASDAATAAPTVSAVMAMIDSQRFRSISQ